MKTINQDQIEEIKSLVLKRNSHQEIKEILNNLEDSNEQVILQELKNIINNKGRSTIRESDIRDIINKYWREE